MNTTHMILVDSSVAGSDVKKMSQEIEKVDGVKWVLGLDNLVGSGVPADMLPESVTGMLKNDKYQLLMVNSTYKVATDKVNKQIEQIDKIMDKYDKGAMLVGEGPLTKDLINITDTDFKRVSAVSIGIVFDYSASVQINYYSGDPGRCDRICDLCEYGYSVLHWNKAAVCGINRNRYDPAWRDCGLCDPDDHQISEREKPRRRQI